MNHGGKLKLNKLSFMKKHKPADIIQDIQYFGEYGGVNPSIVTLLLLHIWQEKLWKWYSEENVKAVICIQDT